MKTEYTTLRNTINQLVPVCTRLGETVMGHLVSIKRSLVKRSQEDCRLSVVA